MDLEYTEECKEKTDKYPLDPERVKLYKEDLATYQLDILVEHHQGFMKSGLQGNMSF